MKNGGGSAFCIRISEGDKILNAASTDYHNLHGCNRVPLNPDGTYTIVSASIRAKFIKKKCPTALLGNDDLLTMCSAFGLTSSGEPTLALVKNGNLLNCVASHPAVIKMSGGFSKKVSAAIQATGLS